MTTALPPDPRDSNLWRSNRRLSRQIDFLVRAICFVFAAISILTTLGIVLTLVFESLDFFLDPYFRQALWLEQLTNSIAHGAGSQAQSLRDQVEAIDPRQLVERAKAMGLTAPGAGAGVAYALKQFFTDTRWTPLFKQADFGIFVLISATLMTTAIAMVVAIPLGLLIAIALSEYAPPPLRQLIKPVLELIAGVPSVVFGYFALLTVTPFLKTFIPGIEVFNALSAGLVLGICVLPLVASLSEDAIHAVPEDLRHAALAMGATKREMIQAVVMPAAISGIVASIILALSRAIGETMIVSLAAGQNPQPIDASFNFLNPLIPVMTMTSFIVQVSQGDVPFGTLPYKTIFIVGMALFVLTLSLNIVSYWFVRRFREKYD
ncbi:MAG: phosphate ABC transporter permease subunit PstC [Nodosilinea sp.]